eukprot:CAMPEP_0113879952 /NCGR_PEP_ID=MMETSP0780_2-20120614/7515_1 /TAXON_ID=652834 /ORGANISM="Palpitomonas bilix" /LENGTH=311 /DNA_ID=CAMNT_0000866573 /DNA_START=23 /DNA_END=958 /DNA_ORIENTATION=- /assembly_acc=CAM_ASM_000599
MARIFHTARRLARSPLFAFAAGGVAATAALGFLSNRPELLSSNMLLLDSPRDVAVRPPSSVQKVLEFGAPSFDELKMREGYVAAFDKRTRNPLWAAEYLTEADLKTKLASREDSKFKEDDSVPPLFRAKLADYAGSGFDRGHLVPATDMRKSQSAMDETFLLTNISPQVGKGFNRDYWGRFEEFCRRLTRDFSDVWVISGPLYLPKRESDGKWWVKYQVIGEPPNVAVPTHFFKVILTKHKNNYFAIGAFVLPNAVIDDKAQLENFRVPVEFVEKSSGLTFFRAVNRNNASALCSATKCELPGARFWKKGA